MSATPIQASTRDVTGSRERALLLDPWLIIAALGLVACSLVTIYGATRRDVPGNAYYFVERQAIYAAVGFIVAMFVTRFDYSRLRDLRLGIYGLLVGSNLLVLVIAGATRGSRRWIDLPFFRVQPSELGKVLLVLALAGFVVDRARWLNERRTTARIVLLALLPALLVVAQPDLGTGMVYMAVTFMLLFVAGTSWKHMTALVALVVIAASMVLVVAPAAGVHVLKPYQVQRLTGFLKPSHDPGDQTYQINQSLTAIGSGEKTGRGIDRATQTNGNFLPEHHTDFIFAVVGETHGFLGAAVVLALYALLIWRTLRILTLAKNLYGALIAGGILAMLMFQAFVNVGMTIGIMPITGVPLPLMSFGGSSVLVTFICLGLLQSIHVQGRIAAASKGRALIL
ncbi:MAG: rod shape-determining protein RodA [Solirubrobacteraceae bacterium]